MSPDDGHIVTRNTQRLTNILRINCAPSWLYLHENITIFSLYIMFTPTCFDTSVSSSGSLKNLSFVKLHKFFKLKLLKLQFHKIIRLKLFGCRWVIQYSFCNITISCESKVYMWLHILSLVTVAEKILWYIFVH